MKKLTLVLVICGLISTLGCKSTPKLEPGGVYAPTNEVGQVTYNEIGLALADASYKLAWETVQTILNFERDNRKVIWGLSPNIKRELDKLRPQLVNVNSRWANARLAYQANPTPAGLSTIQSLLAELQRLIPLVQQQIAPAYKAAALTPPSK